MPASSLAPAQDAPARLSLATFPLHEITHGPDGTPACACTSGAACTTIGKHPAYAYSELATGEQVPPVADGAGMGIATGTRSGIFVVDLDVRPADGKDGVAALAALGDLPPTVTVATPTGGLHLYFRTPVHADGSAFYVKNSAGVLGPGIDVRGEGGFVVAPGSPHRNGGRYEALTVEDGASDEVADAPAWLVALLEARDRPAGVSDASGISPIVFADVADVEDAARTFLAKTPVAVEKQGGDTRLREVCLHLVTKLKIRPEDALALLTEEGGWNARCLPPWDEATLSRNLDRMSKGKIAHNTAPAWWDVFVARAVASTDRVPAPKTAPVPPTDLNPNVARKKAPTPGHLYRVRFGDTPRIEGHESIGPNKAVFELFNHAEWQGVLQHNIFTDRIEAVDPPMQMDAEGIGGMSDQDIRAVQLWFGDLGKSVTLETAQTALITSARRRPYHPVREYLNALPPATDAGRAALKSFASNVFGNADPMAAVVVTKTLVAAVRRVMRPGTKVDTVLILSGAQGVRKTTMLGALFGDDYVRSQLPKLDSKDSSASLQGFWIVEMGELDKLTRAENNNVKEFLSRQVDTYRPSYGKCDIRRPRETVFIGSTNEGKIPEDTTGNRRYWPIEVKKTIDLDYVREHRDEIWAAALELARDDSFKHWFENDSDADALRDDFVTEHPWTETIRDYVTGRATVRSAEVVYVEAIARADGNALSKVDQKIQTTINGILKALGCVNKTTRDGAKTAKTWHVPEELAKAAPSAEETKRRIATAVVAKLAA